MNQTDGAQVFYFERQVEAVGRHVSVQRVVDADVEEFVQLRHRVDALPHGVEFGKGGNHMIR